MSHRTDSSSKRSCRSLAQAFRRALEKEQLQGAFDGIVLLHETYNLNLTDLAAGDINIPGPLHNGKYNKIKSSYEFSATDLEFAGKHSYNLDYYDRAYEFIAAAIQKSKQKEEFKNQTNFGLF